MRLSRGWKRCPSGVDEETDMCRFRHLPRHSDTIRLVGGAGGSIRRKTIFEIASYGSCIDRMLTVSPTFSGASP